MVPRAGTWPQDVAWQRFVFVSGKLASVGTGREAGSNVHISERTSASSEVRASVRRRLAGAGLALAVAAAPTLVHGGIAGREATSFLPMLNLDLLLVFAASPWLAPWLAVLAWWLVLAADVLLRVAGVYLMPVGDALAHAGNLLALTTPALVTLVVAILVVVLGTALLGRGLARGARWCPTLPARSAAVILLVLGVADLTNGTSQFTIRQAPAVPANLAGSGLLWVARRLTARDAGGLEPPASELAVVGSANLLQRARDGRQPLPPRLALVLVESMGLPTDTTLLRWIREPVLAEAERAGGQWDARTVPFRGPTISGELRELCGVLGEADPARVEPARCLPARLRQLGYRTMALHGNTLRMYRRRHWWPDLGFSDVTGADELPAEVPRSECAWGMVGVCDRAAGRLVREFLASPIGANERGRFAYWLTLDSHLPVAGYTARRAVACPALPSLADAPPATCAWLWTLRSVHEEVAHWIADARVRPLQLVIAGDHAPPKVSSELSARFVDGLVPALTVEIPDAPSADPEGRVPAGPAVAMAAGPATRRADAPRVPAMEVVPAGLSDR